MDRLALRTRVSDLKKLIQVYVLRLTQTKMAETIFT